VLRGLALLWLGRGRRGLRRLLTAIEAAARETPAEAARSGSALLVQAEAARVPGAIGRVARRTLEAARSRRETLDDAISEALLGEEAGIERFHSAIGVIAAVAPLLGLLGTVTGMIATFDIITELGTGDPKMLSSGISEALITTELGLVVAIPLLLCGTLLGGLASRIAADLEAAALAIANRTPPAAPESLA
jgi:biopolymer transport protein ExbB